MNIDSNENWYGHVPQTVTEKDKITILWNMLIQTDREIKANGPEIIINNKQEKSCLLIDMSNPTEKNISVKSIWKTLKIQGP